MVAARIRATLGRAALITLLADALFWTAAVAALWQVHLVVVVVAGLVAAILTVLMIAPALRHDAAHLPRSWFILVILLPFTSHWAVARGAWSGADPRSRLRYRAGVSILLILCLVAAGTGQLDRYAEAAGLGMVERQASEYLTSTLKKASVVLLVVASLNSTVSVLKSFDISIGVGIRLGEALDPVDDLIERFSLIMFISTASITAQLLLMKIGKAIGLTVFLSVALVLLLLGMWLPHSATAARFVSAGTKIFLFALVTRIAIPMIALVGTGVSSHFLADTYNTSKAALEQSAEELDGESEKLHALHRELSKHAVDKGLWGRIKDLPAALAGWIESLDLSDRLSKVQKRLADLTEHIIRLLAVFILEAILIPLLAAWGLIKLTRMMSCDPRRFDRFAAALAERTTTTVRTPNAGEPL